MKIKNKVINLLHERINKKNRKRLKNTTPTLICSNCAGGFIYHWLGLKFRSPFINLFLTPEDFIKALENFDEFINTPLKEVKNSGEDYLVGEGAYDIKVYFMHYKNFEEAVQKWNERKTRINKNNMGIILSNYSVEGSELLKRFDLLPYKHKIVFVDKPVENLESTFYLKKFTPGRKNLYRTISLSGKRCIDQFDYVEFINSLKEKV